MSTLTPKQAIALQLARQGRTIPQIQTNTGLGREQILAAFDLAEAERYRRQHPNVPMPPCRKGARRAVR